jgi:hypothetical protein
MYIILPSNTGDFSTNTISSFRVKLPQGIIFSGEWEVALTEIQYPISWNTVKENDGQVTIYYSHNGISIPIEIKINSGYYDNIEELLRAIKHAINREGELLVRRLYRADFAMYRLTKLKVNDNDKYKAFVTQGVNYAEMLERPEIIPNPSGGNSNDTLLKLAKNLAKSEKLTRHPPKTNMLDDILKITYIENIKRVHVNWVSEKSIKGITFSRSLQFMLGFPNSYSFKVGSNIAKFNPDISGSVSSFFVYSNIVQPQIVGNSSRQLLRTIPIRRGSLGSTVHKEFTISNYVGLLSRGFDTIEIEIRNDFGELIDFQFGKVIVKLHFRKKPLLNL